MIYREIKTTFNFLLFILRDFLVKVLYQEAIQHLEKLDMEHHLLLEIGNGFVDKSGYEKLNYSTMNSIKIIVVMKIL